MPNVVFVAPFLLPSTMRIAERVVAVDGVDCAIISQNSADGLPGHVLARLRDFEQVGDALDAMHLLEGVRRLGQRLGPIHRLFGAMEHAQVQIAEVREALGIEGMGVEAARNFRDKARMKDVLRSHGLPCARHRLAAAPEHALEFVAEVGLPVVLKPPAGAGALGTWTVRDEATLREYLAVEPPGPGREILLEEFVVGDELTLDSVCVEGRPLWHSVSRYIPSPLEANEKPWVQLCILIAREREPRHEAILGLGSRALASLGMWTGLSHLEWFERPDGSIAISEVAARPAGEQLIQIIGHAHGVDLFFEWAKLMVYGHFEPPERRFSTGVAFLRGQGDGRVVGIDGFESVADDLGPILVEHSLPHAGRENTSHYGGVGYVIVRDPSTAVVEEALARIITGVRVLVG